MEKEYPQFIEEESTIIDIGKQYAFGKKSRNLNFQVGWTNNKKNKQENKHNINNIQLLDPIWALARETDDMVVQHSLVAM